MKNFHRLFFLIFAVISLAACEDAKVELTPGNPDGPSVPVEPENPGSQGQVYYSEVDHEFMDWSGDYLITYRNPKVENIVALGSFDSRYGQPALDANESEINFYGDLTENGFPESVCEPYKAVFTKDGSGYNINVSGIGFIGLETSANKLHYAKSIPEDKHNKYIWNISFDEEIHISSSTFRTRRLQWNAHAPRFACYTGNQEELTLFRSTVIEGLPAPDPDRPGDGEEGGGHGEIEPIVPGLIPVTVRAFRDAEVSDAVWYQLHGTIKNIYNTKFGDFYLDDGTGSVLVYGLTAKKTANGKNDRSFGSLKLKEGDVVTIAGTRGIFEENNEIEVHGTAYFLAKEGRPDVPGPNPTPDPEPDPDQPGGDVVDPDPITPPSGTSGKYSWSELPVINDADGNLIDDNDKTLYYASHFCAGPEKDPSGRKARNFTVCYSAEHHCPVWVAAPRHKMYVTGNGHRTNGYGKDPVIPSSIQYSSKSTGGGCNKGHMLGSAERLSSDATNRQVFYYTNIAPQDASSHNTGGGAWNNLEDQVDTYVCADTLYQIIGCYFKQYEDAYGNVAVPKKISFGGRSDVTRPTAFYCALLRTKNGNTEKAVADCTSDELQCVAFIVSHEQQKGHEPCRDDMMTISQLEKLTGFTFFPNVPNAPKDRFNASDWGM